MKSLSGLVFIVSLALYAIAGVWASSVDGQTLPPTATIIDILSSTAQYSILLHYIQKLGLVPLINSSRNITLIAPINAAFEDFDPKRITRELILYHLINGTVSYGDIYETSIYYSYLHASNVEDPAFGVPVIFQRVPVSDENGDAPEMNDTISTKGNGDHPEFEVFINKETKIIDKDHFAGINRGVVQAVDSFLELPDKTCLTMGSLPMCSQHTKLLQIESSCDREFVPSVFMTFVPSDTAYEVFDRVEMNYLLSVHATKDRQKILWRHTFPSLLLPQQIKASGSHYLTLDDVDINIKPGYVVDDVYAPRTSDILTSDGLINIYDEFLTTEDERPMGDKPFKPVDITPKKYLYGLSKADFIKEVTLAGVEKLINGSVSTPQTIFVPNLDDDDSVDFMQQSPASTANILYHFVEGQLSIDELKRTTVKHKLLSTKFTSPFLNDKPQRLKFTHGKRKFALNGHEIISPQYVVGNTSIYVIDGDLDLPSSLTLALGPFFANSYSIKFLDSLDLLDLHSGKKGWTYLLPSRDAWESQMLVTKYLSGNETALQTVFGALIFHRPFYIDDECDHLEEFNFLDDIKRKVGLHYDADEDVNYVTIHDADHSVMLSSLPLDSEDILFDRGVAHSVKTLPIPNALTITAEDLIRAGGREYYLEYLDKRNLSHVLDSKESYTILVPSEQSLLRDNITSESDNIDFIIGLHLLPGNPVENLLSNKYTDGINTMTDVDLVCRNVSDKLYLITVKDGVGTEALVSEMGHANIDGNHTSTVLFLDKYISPDWIKQPIIRPPFRLNTHIAILIGVAAGIIGMFFVVAALFFAIMATKTSNVSEPSEREPLIGDQSDSMSHSRSSDTEADVGYASTNANGNGSVESSGTAPIRTKTVQQNREFGRHLALVDRGD